uniref:Uncharacterized protein n=1 Tax=viral metagenome TaxID=1070528 RepID=A0A6M3LGH7_9ZZZZ
MEGRKSKCPNCGATRYCYAQNPKFGDNIWFCPECHIDVPFKEIPVIANKEEK